jgi:hypothetical protein
VKGFTNSLSGKGGNRVRWLVCVQQLRHAIRSGIPLFEKDGWDTATTFLTGPGYYDRLRI